MNLIFSRQSSDTRRAGWWRIFTKAVVRRYDILRLVRSVLILIARCCGMHR